MDLFQIIDDIAQVDPEVYGRFDSRRAAFRHFSGFGKKVAAAALPLALPALFNKAYGQTTALDPLIVATLNLALQLGYLEKYFYQTALAFNILNAEEAGAIAIILNDENLHINTLRGVLGGQAIADPTRAGFDYTGSQNKARPALFPTLGGTSAPTTGNFSSKADFLLVGKQFVDTGVRAYKGGAPNLMGNKDILEAALNIHSVEAGTRRAFVRCCAAASRAPRPPRAGLALTKPRPPRRCPTTGWPPRPPPWAPTTPEPTPPSTRPKATCFRAQPPASTWQR